MQVISCRNVNEAFPQALQLLYEDGQHIGDEVVYPEPVTINFIHPQQRVLFSEGLDLNPFDSFFCQGLDQTDYILEKLRKKDTAIVRVGTDTKEAVHTFRLNFDWLDLCVFDPKADIARDLFGENFVFDSYRMEYIAEQLGLRMGELWITTPHLYAKIEDINNKKLWDLRGPAVDDPYTRGKVSPFLLGSTEPNWEQEFKAFFSMRFDESYMGFKTTFFRRVAAPIRAARNALYEDDIDLALERIEHCKADDWRKACTEWLERRRMKKQRSSEKLAR